MVSSGRWQQLWQLISDRSLNEDVPLSPALVCEVCATLTVTGVGLSVMSASVTLSWAGAANR